MVLTTQGYCFDVERGPDWLYVRLSMSTVPVEDSSGLADEIWEQLQRQFTYRAVLEMHDVPMLTSELIGQLIVLLKRAHEQGGALRLCGLSEACQESLKICRLQQQLPNYRDREEAVHGSLPHQPR